MTLRKEWLGFFLCVAVLFLLVLGLLLHSRNQFKEQVIESNYNLLSTELNELTDDISFKLLDRDLVLFDLDLPEVTSDWEQMLEEIILELLSFPMVSQAFAYDEKGSPVRLEIGSQNNQNAFRFSSLQSIEQPFFVHQAGHHFSYFFKVDSLDDPFIMEIQVNETFILREWKAIDQEFSKLGLISFSSGTLLLFLIFKYLSERIQDRQTKLEQINSLLQKTNQQLAQSYKTSGLGALSGHLMHSLKTPLTHLQMIVKEAENKKEIDVNELRDIQVEIRELVSQSLQSLQDVENNRETFSITVAELFKQVVKRTERVSRNGHLDIESENEVPNEIGNLHSTMLLAILTLLVENAFEAQPTTSVILSARIVDNKLSIFVKDSSGGIPDSEKEFLFEPSKSRKKRGTGLGLAISRQLALSIDAELNLIRTDTTGSTFSISLISETS